MVTHSSDFEPLAIVGIGCKLPGKVTGPKEFWSLLRDGRTGIREIPGDRFSLDSYYDPNPAAMGKTSVKWGGFIEGIREFDAEFFGISPREAEAMDPQQRMMLTAVWEAFEDAGISAERLRGSNTSVFVGACASDYAAIQRYRRTGENVHAGTGGAMCIVANRVSHKFDFHGPSLTVDTACSSSLVATDLACNSIWKGQSDVAIAGGVNSLLDPGVFINFSKANMISRTGKIRTFDAEADGYVRGEGVGAVIIKKLSKALEDGDRIYSVIRATNVNQDGYTSTISVPSSEAQSAMLSKACEKAGLGTSDIDFIEAHGTGTPVGDPAEARAIGMTFGMHRNRKRKILIGAGKTNTGHLESAAGITGLIKASLSLHNKQISRNLNFKRPNPAIPFDELGIDVPREHMEWEADNGRPRRAAVNAFGIGGTNACAILEEAPAHMNGHAKHLNGSRQYWFLPLGAQTDKALAKVADQVADSLEGANEETSHAVGANLALRRAHMTFRGAAIADNPADAIKLLRRSSRAIETGRKLDPALITGRRIDEPRIVFAFAGQGGTWWGMAHGLMKHDQVFRQTIEEIDRLYFDLAGWSIKEELLKGDGQNEPSTTHVLPCLFALQSGLVARWRAWGIKPHMVIGHSSGELATAYAAGILTLPDALKVVAHRARLQATQEGRGGIAAVALSRAQVERDLEEWGMSRIDIAAVNGPSMINIAGDNEALKEAVAKLKEKHGEDLFATVLKVDFAPHCHHMDPLRDDLLGALDGVRPLAGTVPMISTVTGHLMVGQMADGTYWWRNIRDPVLFDQGLREAMRLGGNVFIEIGPHINLSAMISGTLSERGQSAVVIPSLNRNESYDKILRTGLATLYVNGVEPKWESFYGNHVPHREMLGYPWEKKPFWIESEEQRAALMGPHSHPLLGARALAPNPLWQNEISLEEHAFLNDHQVDGSVIFPGAGYLEMMFAAGRELFGEGAIELENVEILEAMILAAERSELVQTVFEPARTRISVYSRPRGSNLDWILRARGIMRLIPNSAPVGKPIKTPKGTALQAGPLYKQAAKRGYAYGPTFQGMRKLWAGQDEAVGYVHGRGVDFKSYRFHPALLDSALHVAFGLAAGFGAVMKGGDTNRLYLPVRFERVVLHQALEKPVFWSRTRKVEFDESVAINDTFVEDERGRPILDLEGFTARAIPGRRSEVDEKALKPVFIVEDWVEAEPKVAKKREAAHGQTWLVFRDKAASGLAARAEAALANEGAAIATIVPGAEFKKLAPGLWQVNPQDVSGFERVLEDAVAANPKHKRKIFGVLFGWDLRVAETTEGYDSEILTANETKSTIAAMHLVQALAKQTVQKPRLWFLTRGTLPAGEDMASGSIAKALAGAPLAGFARTALTEHADFQATVLDFDADTKAARTQADELAPVLLGATEETEIALRGKRWFVPRVRQAEGASLPAKQAPATTAERKRQYRLGMTAVGDLDNLRLMETDALTPGKGQIKIDVKAGGLNFRDVMAATGLLPLDAEIGTPSESLGMECGGIVSAVGPGVKGFRVGDRIMASAKGVFRSEIVTSTKGVYKIPRHMSYVDAATVPAAFSTAHFALVRLARMREGETVLIHLGTGGVGLAAIQIARYLKAEIISTAGSPEKRAYLKKLGIKHVYDSRSLSFADDIRRATNGRGVDVVLNSLAGEAIPLGIAVMAPNGRFIEIGKRDIYSDNALGMRNLRRNASFFVLDMARMDRDDPQGLMECYAEILRLLDKKVLKPLPAMIFPATKIADAFKTMAQAKHIGKVIIDFSDDEVPIDLSTSQPLALSPKGAYLISGGLGGFGAEVARWLADNGAKHLYLIGRSGASRPEAKALMADLKGRGVTAHAIAADIGKRADIDAILKKIAKAKLPLRGIMHSAMVLDDGFITQLNAERMMRVLEPKILGAWNLHEATEGMPLDFFVMFSSLASVFGSSGQANYVAANRFLDLLASQRRAHGLPAATINWGTLGGAGAVQRSKELLKYLKSMGMPPMDVQETLGCLGVILRKDVSAVGACKVDWKALGRTNTAMRKLPRFAEVTATTAGGASAGRIRTELLAVKGADRERMLKEYIGQQVARVLKIEAKTLEPTRPLNELGLDSLTSFQLKNKIESEVGVSLPVGKFLQKPTIDSLALTINEVLEQAPVDKRDNAATAKAKTTGRALSPRQEWAWRRIHEDGPMPMHGMMEQIATIKIKPAFDVERVNQSFRKVLEANEVLRSSFPTVDGEPTVNILPLEKFEVRGIDTTNLDDEAFLAELRRLALKPHDLDAGPLIDLRVYHRPDNHSVVVLRGHVILADGWTFGMILREIFQGYFGLGTVADAGSGKDKLTYFDYARWHNNWIASDDGQKARAFWKEKLANLPAPLQVGDRAPALIDPHARGSYVKTFIAAKEGWEAREAARKLGLSMHAVFAAAYHAQLHGITGATDVVLVSNIANRARAEHEQVAGWMANQMFVRCGIDPNMSFREHAARVAHAMSEPIEHSGYPAHMMLEAAAESNKGTIVPHFAGFNMMWPDNMDRSGFERLMFEPEGTVHRFGDLEITMLPVSVEGVGHFLNDTAVIYQEVDGDLLFALHSRDGVFDGNGAKAYLERFLRVLPQALKNPDLTVAELARIA